jgi:integrase
MWWPGATAGAGAAPRGTWWPRCAACTSAEDDGLVAEADNPARKVDKPRRLPSTRRALPDTRLAEINQGAAAGGNDPELDTLILRLHTETACRRAGALALRPQDLDPDQCLVRLREKGETVRWQPVSPTLMGCLLQHAQERHAPETPVPGPARTVRSWPLLVLAAPAAAEVWSGWVGVARSRHAAPKRRGFHPAGIPQGGASCCPRAPAAPRPAAPRKRT